MRNLKVETYLEMTSFMKQVPFQENTIYITASSSLAMYLKYLPQFADRKGFIWTYESLRKAVLTEYYDPIEEWKMKTALRSLIEELPESKIKENLYKNRTRIYDIFQFYLRSGIFHLEPEDGKSSGEKEWRKLYNQWVSTDLLKEVYFEQLHLEKQTLVERLNTYYQNKFNQDDSMITIKEIKKIVFINLTFLDPTRFYFIKQLDNLGIEVSFWIPRNGYQLPWKRTYDFIPEDCISHKFQNDMDERESAYTAYLRGEYIDGKHEAVKVRIYEDILEFKEQLKKKPIYQNNREMEKKEQIPHVERRSPLAFKYEREYVNFSKERFNRLFNSTIVDYNHMNVHYFDSQAGKFLQSVYHLKWSKSGEDILLNYEDYCNIMVSGWIQTKKGLNGRGCYDILMELKPYMDGVQSLREIENRLFRLTHLQEFSATFDQVAKDKVVGNCIKKYLQNPLEVFPYADNSRWELTIKQLLELTKRLKNVYQELVEKENRICLKKHIRHICELWKSNPENQEKIHKIKKLEQYAKNNPEYQKEYRETKRDFRLFIKAYKKLSYLNKTIEDESYYLPEEVEEFMRIQMKFPYITKYSSEEWEEDNGFNMLKSFAQLDGFTVNGTKEIYITDLSEKSLSKYVNQNNKMMTMIEQETFANDLKTIAFYSEEEKRIVLQHVKQDKEIILGFIKYFIGNIITSSKAKIEFSMIRGINDNDYSSSILRVLSSIYKVEEERVLDFKELEMLKSLVKKNLEQEDNEDSLSAATSEPGNKLQVQISPLGWLDWDFCPYKFFLNNVVAFHPVYTEEFQQRILFSELGKILMSQQTDAYDMRKYYFYLFPQWNQTLKENMLDTTYQRNIREDVSYENIKFPYDMKSLQLLRSIRSKHVRRRAIGAYYDRVDRGETFWKEFMKKDYQSDTIATNRGHHCTMCPYKLTCVKGEFPIERQKY